MQTDKQIDAKDAQAMLRLSQEIQAEVIGAARQEKLLRGLCKLVRGRTAACIVTRTDRQSREPVVLSCVQTRGIPDPQHPREDEHLVRMDDVFLRSEITLRDPERTVSVQVAREGARFSEYDRALVDLVHRGMLWIYENDLPAAQADPASSAQGLSRRQRETLEALLVGDSEKQIAAKLKLSPNTIHHYVKGIYRHYNVNTRGELLAHFLAVESPVRRAPAHVASLRTDRETT